MKSRMEQARARFQQGYNCAQAVFATYADLFGMDEKTALRVSAGLGGGVGRMREVCGAFTASSLLAGMEHGAIDGSDAAAKKQTYAVVQQMGERFKADNGGTVVCRELLGLAKAEGDPTPQARTGEYYKKRPCVQIVCDAARMVEETLFPGQFTEESV